MQLAREMLDARPAQSIAQVAEGVGYRSEWAFAKAFKRQVGMGPGAWRRANRTTESA